MAGVAESVLRAYLEPSLAADPEMDTLLLGCTHYPLLREPIEEIVGPGVAVVDSAFTTAVAVEDPSTLSACGLRSAARRPTGSRRRGTSTRSSRSLSGSSTSDSPKIEIEPVASLPLD